MSRPEPSRAQRIERRAAERARRDGPPVMPIPDTIRDLSDQVSKEEDDCEV